MNQRNIRTVFGNTWATITSGSFLLLVLLAVTSCTDSIRIVSRSTDRPRLTPDYVGVTIPCNIAPLCFSIEGMDDAALIVRCGSDSIVCTTSDGSFDIPESDWTGIMGKAKGSKLTLTVCRPADGGWQALSPFDIYVSADSIDPYVVYRKIQPGYGLWDRMGIYQRNLTTYDEEPIYQNREGSGNCVNCHSFNQGSPSKWQVHIRRNHGGTYIISDGKAEKLQVQAGADGNAVKPVYPSWHPGGRYIAYSTNKTFFHIHTRDKNRWEVMDDGSDVMVIDTQSGEVLQSPLTAAKDRYETYPCFSPDGKWLYFSSAASVDTLTRQYDKVQYRICRIAFDAANATFGTKVDTLTTTAGSASYYFPRISPDGRWLCCTRSAYGNFGVCHRDADLCLIDLHTGNQHLMSAANSNYGDSWHSWSSNSRWLVFSSKRSDGIYTRLYFTHIDRDGRCTKAFVMPQRSAKNYYDMQMDGYNIPELVRGKVSGSPADAF